MTKYALGTTDEKQYLVSVNGHDEDSLSTRIWLFRGTVQVLGKTENSPLPPLLKTI